MTLAFLTPFGMYWIWLADLPFVATLMSQHWIINRIAIPIFAVSTFQIFIWLDIFTISAFLFLKATSEWLKLLWYEKLDI